MLPLRSIDVVGLTLEAAFDGTAFWVPMKRFCAAIDVGWDAQRQRIERLEVLREARRLLVFATDGGPQEMVALPHQSLPLFLLRLQSRRHAAHKRASIDALRAMSAERLYVAFQAAYGAECIVTLPG